MIGDKRKFWQKKVIKIFIINKPYPAFEKTALNRAVKEYENNTGLVFRFPNDIHQADISILFDKNLPRGYGISEVGTDNFDKLREFGYSANNPTMRIGTGYYQSGYSLDKIFPTLLHEFGHALGFLHEHQHPDCNIEWNSDIVYKQYVKPDESPNTGRRRIDKQMINRYNRSVDYFITQYDPLSIMHYNVDPSYTMNNIRVDDPSELSVIDKMSLRLVYN